MPSYAFLIRRPGAVQHSLKTIQRLHLSGAKVRIFLLGPEARCLTQEEGRCFGCCDEIGIELYTDRPRGEQGNGFRTLDSRHAARMILDSDQVIPL